MQTYTPPTRARPTPAHLILFRKTFGLTQETAASLCDVTRVTWNRWERGQSQIPKHLWPTLVQLVVELRAQQQENEDGTE